MESLLEYLNRVRRSSLESSVEDVTDRSLLEYLNRKSQATYDYTRFLSDLNDVEGIVNWLESNGFRSVGIKTFDEMQHLSNKSYSKGPMSKNPDTHWIKFTDGRGTVVQIRTVNNFHMNPNHPETSKIYVLQKKHGLDLSISADELRDVINKYFIS